MSRSPLFVRALVSVALVASVSIHAPAWAVGVQEVADTDDVFGWAVAIGDFDCDGTDDLATTAAREKDAIGVGAPTVQVIYDGGRWDSLWQPATEGESPVDTDAVAFAVGDFDSDGCDDLAVGLGEQNLGTVDDAGQVHVLHGSPTGLVDPGEVWSQDSSGIFGIAELSDLFGYSLAVGDFDGNGSDDLAIGILAEGRGAIDNGGVEVLYSTAGGLSSTGSAYWDQNSTGIDGTSEDWDGFGNALAAGDFDGDGYDDLAVGVEHEGVYGFTQAGSVNVLYGGSTGIASAGNVLLYQGNAGVDGTLDYNEHFGASLAAVDFDGDGYDDLAIGADSETQSGFSEGGSVYVRYGSSTGLSSTGDQTWTQDTSSILGTMEFMERFGSRLGVALGGEEYTLYSRDELLDLARRAGGRVEPIRSDQEAFNLVALA